MAFSNRYRYVAILIMFVLLLFFLFHQPSSTQTKITVGKKPIVSVPEEIRFRTIREVLGQTNFEVPRILPNSDFVSVNATFGGRFKHFEMVSHRMVSWVSGEYWGEQCISDVFMQILQYGCEEDEIVLDIGANIGYYGMLAASLGCKVLMFDPQPQCARYIQTNIERNNFQSQVRVIPRPASDSPITMSVSESTGCDGRFPMTQIEQNGPDVKIENGTDVTAVVIEDLIHKKVKIKIAKIDTEGAEYWVMKSLKNMISHNRIENIIVEASPLFWQSRKLSRSLVADVFEENANLGNYEGVWFQGPQVSIIPLSGPREIRKWILEYPFDQRDLWMFKKKTGMSL